MADLAVTDSHALLWYGLGRRRKVGKRAWGLLVRADQGSAAVYVPTVVLVEIGEASRRGLVTLADGFVRWCQALFSGGGFLAVDLTVDVVQRAQELYAIPKRGDRLIAATAAQLDLPLITRDPEIGRLASIDVIW